MPKKNLLAQWIIGVLARDVEYLHVHRGQCRSGEVSRVDILRYLGSKIYIYIIHNNNKKNV